METHEHDIQLEPGLSRRQLDYTRKFEFDILIRKADKQPYKHSYRIEQAYI